MGFIGAEEDASVTFLFRGWVGNNQYYISLDFIS